MKVNILLSTFNGERYLCEQLESILAQSFTQWTLLARDDGSTDATFDILKKFAARDERIRLVEADEQTHKNLGLIESFYRLVKHEEADYYFFADQDDVWLPNKLDITLRAALNQALDASVPLLVYTDLSIVDESLKVLQPSMIRYQSRHQNTTLAEELAENTVTGGTMLINHALARLWQTTNDLIMHDWYLALLAAAMGHLVYLDTPTELYRQHSSNAHGANTLAARGEKLAREGIGRYNKLIIRTQQQAAHLLELPLSKAHRRMIESYVSLFSLTRLERLRVLSRYGIKKNRPLFNAVFRLLVLLRSREN